MITVTATKISPNDCKYIITTEGLATSHTAIIDLSLNSFTGQTVSNLSSVTIGVYNQDLEIISAPRNVCILEVRAAMNDAYAIIKSGGNTIVGLKDAGKFLNNLSTITISSNIEIEFYGHGSFSLWLSKLKGYRSIYDPQSKVGVTSFIANSQV